MHLSPKTFLSAGLKAEHDTKTLGVGAKHLSPNKDF